jgi:hypothetical protein
MDYSLRPDTLRCNKSVGTIQITNNSTAGYYTWQTAGGNITGANTDSSQININKPGTYIVSASPAEGCAATRTDTVVIPIDTFPPVATVRIGAPLVNSNLQLYGGDTAASDYPTPSISMLIFSVLSTADLALTGRYSDQSITLDWSDLSQNPAGSYSIEKLMTNNQFIGIGTVTNPGNAAGLAQTTTFSFADRHPVDGSNTYRIRASAVDGQSYYSPVVTVAAGERVSASILSLSTGR